MSLPTGHSAPRSACGPSPSLLLQLASVDAAASSSGDALEFDFYRYFMGVRGSDILVN